MTQDVQTLIDVLRKFGSDLGLPKLDVDQLIKTQRSHLDAFAQATQIAAEGAASIAKKQREVLAAGLREASELAHEYKPSGSPQEMLAKQAEFANKALDITVQNARDVSAAGAQDDELSKLRNVLLLVCQARPTGRRVRALRSWSAVQPV